MENKKILFGLTTITDGEWKNKVKEIDELGLKEIALFPTCLEYKERQELYKLLEKTKLVCIPHVHLREEDMDTAELDYLVERFKTQVFNIHAGSGVINFLEHNKKYQDRIYVENTLMEDDFEKVLELCAGVCLDLSHWEDFGFLKKSEGYKTFSELLKKNKIGINHISGIKGEKVHCYDKFNDLDFYNYSDHRLNELSELDYVKKYKDYLADIISIELENPFKRQLEIKKYLEKIIL